MKTASPYLYFNGNTEEVFNFYKTVFGVEFTFILRFGELEGNPMEIDEQDQNKIAHVSLPLGDTLLMGADQLEKMGPPLSIGNNFSITLSPESIDEAEEVFNSLSEGGQVLMPLKREFWAEKFGVCIDKFGIQWKISYEGDAIS